MTQINLPFKVGQVIEARSFEMGFRGAWFRCKILSILTEGDELFYNLEYLDFPEERIHKTQVFEMFPDGTEKWLMIRPAYPPVYHESESLKIKRDREVEPLLVIHDSWKVGDLVDWWRDDCYWSGKILKLQKNEAVQIELSSPPFGEGSIYEALSKDLRPLLEWSLEDGWKLPSKDGKKRQCAKLIKQKNEDKVAADFCQTGTKQKEKATQKLNDNGDLKLNIMESDEIEAAVYDLEELVVRIKWLKGMLRPDVGDSYWKCEDYRATSMGI